MTLEVINEVLINKLTDYRSFQGKKILLTLAFDKSQSKENIEDIIRDFQAGVPTRRDRDQAKLISELVRETINYLSTLEALPKEGGILFSGLARKTGGSKEFISAIVYPLIDGYEDYFRGYIETRFYTDPLKQYMIGKMESELKKQKELMPKILSDIQKELKKPNPSILIGCSPVKEALIEGKGEKIIISKRLRNGFICPKCGVLLKISERKCEYCNWKIGKAIKSCFDEIKELCEHSNTEFIDFNEEITNILDEKYYSIVCFTRY